MIDAETTYNVGIGVGVRAAGLIISNFKER